MTIEQIYDKTLAHGSYAVESNGEVLLVDPGRNPEPYIQFAKKHKGKIVAVFETHPHADFASSHIEFHERFGATIYINPKVGVAYDHVAMVHGDTVKIGNITIKALFTPGHSPDHNSYLLIDEEGKKRAVFTGDSLFVGDVGRPDLREGAGNIQTSRKELAGMMFETINEVFAELPDDVEVFPAHGAGSLCGKNLSDELSSTIGTQKEENWAFQIDDKDLFVKNFLDGQPFIPKYFPHSVELNRQGVRPLEEAIAQVKILTDAREMDESVRIVDARDFEAFKAGHFKGAINIFAGEEEKFETWLGSIIDPEEPFYLVSENKEQLDMAIERTAKIGYERYIKGGIVLSETDLIQSGKMPISEFRKDPEKFTIVDIRNQPEVETEKFFESALEIPLPELNDRWREIPTDQPIVVHCAGGYRSAVGSSILENKLGTQTPIYDLSEAVEEYKAGTEVE